MHESDLCFHNLEWPPPGERVAGPIVWLRGWVVGKSGNFLTDVRVCCATGVHLGVLGLPRTDLATHFKAGRQWLPAEFVVGVPLPAGPAELQIEAIDEHGSWHSLQSLSFTVAADGAVCPRIEGEIVNHPGGSSTVRVPHLPFHGHLDEPEEIPEAKYGRINLFGWLLHETEAVRRVLATTDGLVFNTLESGLTDESLSAKVPEHSGARQARLRGAVDAPPTLPSPCCLRVYAELADGSVHLCFARRLVLNKHQITENTRGRSDPSWPNEEAPAPSRPPKAMPPLASGRPRRLLLIVRTLRPDDATLRALDVVRHLATTGQWVTRIVATEDGPLRREFEDGGCPVQIVDPRAYFAATEPTVIETALGALGREIWWRHLDAVVVFDPQSTWARMLAQQHGIPVFDDPAESLAWFAPGPSLIRDHNADFVAPIRGRANHGAGVLLHAVAHLARHHPTLLGGRKVIVAGLRETVEESLFLTDLSVNPAAGLTAGSLPLHAAAVVCPVLEGHPHRTLLSALAAGVPLITTPSPLLAGIFGPNEVSYIIPGNPLSLAHALVDLLANPAATDRRAEAARRIVVGTIAPAVQLPRWEKRLEAVVRK